MGSTFLKMEYFRFVKKTLLVISTVVVAMPSPQQQQVFGGFGPFIPAVNANSNQGLANTGADLGLGAVGAIAAGNCLFGQNCDLSFRPSLGAAVDANGQIVPQLGVTTQVGNGELAPTFTGGVQLDGNSQSGVGTFVGAGINNGDPNSISPGVQTGFGFSQGQNGQTQATAQLGGNVQAPSLAGINFGQEGNRGSVLGAQPHFLGNPFLAGLLGGR